MSEMFGQMVTHILFDGESDAALKSPGDFLACMSKQDTDIDFRWLRTSLEKERLFLIHQRQELQACLSGSQNYVPCSWLLQLDFLNDLKEFSTTIDGLPVFMKSSVRTDQQKREKVLSVDHWPWNAYIHEDDQGCPTPAKKARRAKTTKSVSKDSPAAMSLSWTTVQRTPSSAKKVPRYHRRPIESAVCTPQPKRVKSLRQEKDSTLLPPEGYRTIIA